MGRCSKALAESRRKTYVLVHGASHGGWCWTRVADPLRDAGHRVFTPTLTGLGDRAHLLSRDVGLETAIKDILALIAMEDLGDVILVGHSFGGLPVSAVADRMKMRIRHLVFLDSAILASGQSVDHLLPPDMVASRRKLAEESSGGITLPAPPPSAFGVTEPDDAAWLSRHLRPMPIRMYQDRLFLENPLGNGLPVTYIACMKPVYAVQRPFHEFARRQPSWSYVELGAPHDAMVVAPGVLTDALLSVN